MKVLYYRFVMTDWFRLTDSFGLVFVRCQLAKQFFDLLIALHDELIVVILRLVGSFQNKQLVYTPTAFERFDDVIELFVLDLTVTQLG